MIACHLIKGLVQPLPIGVTELCRIALLKLLQSLVGLFHPLDELDGRHDASPDRPCVVCWSAGLRLDQGTVRKDGGPRSNASATHGVAMDGAGWQGHGDCWGNGLSTPLTGAVIGWPQR